MNLQIIHLTVSEFKAIKKAVAVLVRAGMSYDTAVDILLTQRENRLRVSDSFRQKIS